MADGIPLNKSHKRKHDSGDIQASVEAILNRSFRLVQHAAMLYANKLTATWSESDSEEGYVAPEDVRCRYRIKLRFPRGHHCIGQKRQRANDGISVDLFHHGKRAATISLRNMHFVTCIFSARVVDMPPSGWKGLLGGSGNARELRSRLRKASSSRTLATVLPESYPTKVPKGLLDLPAELKTQIFSYLPEDLLVEPVTDGTVNVTNAAWIAAVGQNNWKQLLDCKAVSSEFKALIEEAIEWATSRRDVGLVFDARNAPLQNQDLTACLPFAHASLQDLQHQIPNAIFTKFDSLELIVPVKVASITFPTAHCETRVLHILYEQGKWQKSASTIKASWSDQTQDQDDGWNEVAEEGFKEIMDFVRLMVLGPEHPNDLSPRHDFTAVGIWERLRLFALIVDNQNGLFGPNQGYSVVRTANTLRDHATKQEEEISKCRIKLAWHGTHSTDMGGNGKDKDDGISFLTKWRPCAALINGLRWEPPKITKLGWRGSSSSSTTRKLQRDADVRCIEEVVMWLESLSVNEPEGSQCSEISQAQRKSALKSRAAVTKDHGSKDEEKAMNALTERFAGFDVSTMGAPAEVSISKREAELKEIDGVADSLAELHVFNGPKLGWRGSAANASLNKAAFLAAQEKDKAGVAKAAKWLRRLEVLYCAEYPRTFREVFSSLPKITYGSKMSLIVLGNHFSWQFPFKGYGFSSVEGEWWEYAAEHHWPKEAGVGVPGWKLHKAYYLVSSKHTAPVKSFVERSEQWGVCGSKKFEGGNRSQWSEGREEVDVQLEHSKANISTLNVGKMCEAAYKRTGMAALVEWLARL